MRNPSLVTVISTLSLMLLNSGIVSSASRIFSASLFMSSFGTSMALPLPAAAVPVNFPGPVGLLKNALISFFTCSSALISQSTMNNAIMAVTKSA
jgi:hypothetical protein